MGSERRLHPLSFIFAIGQSAKQFVLPAIFATVAARNRDAWEVWAAVFIVPVALVALGRALSVRYRFDPTELVIRSGFVFKRVRHIPYDRVQNVDAVQNVLHRLFGVLEVRVETGGGTDTEAFLRVVNSETLDEIRARVFAARGVRNVEEPPPEAVAAPDVLLRMPPRDVMLFGLIQGRGTIVAGALFGLLWELGILNSTSSATFARDAGGRGIVRQVTRAIFADAAWPFQEVFFGLAGLIILLGIFRVASALWTFLKYYGFTVSRAGDDLRCEYGLLTRVTSTIPIRRIQKVTVREGPWHRLGGRVSLKVQTAGGKAGTETDGRQAWLAPLLPVGDLPRLSGALLLDASDVVDWQPVHPRGARREFIGSLFIIVPVAVGLWFAFGPGGLLIVGALLLWSWFYARRAVAAMRWAVSPNAVHFGSGWLWRTRRVAPLAKIQAVSRHQSPFDRRHHMASVVADVAGGGATESAIRIPYLPAEVGAGLARQLSSAAATTTFHW